MTEPRPESGAEPVAEPVAAPVGQTAGQLLRRARESQGLHIAALATTLKIPPRKLEALERDRYDDLPDPAFTRALAQTACRALKIDAAPVLALLPRPDAAVLDHVSSGLNAPFRDRQAAVEPSLGDAVRTPAFWIVVALVAAAVGVYFWPASAPEVVPATPAPETAAPPVVEPVMPPVVADPAASEPEGAASAPVVPVASTAPAAALRAPAATTSAAPVPAATSAPLLGLRAEADSWVQVTDARGRTLLSRVISGGETVGLDGDVPLRVTIGNAGATTVSFRGVAVDLAAGTRDNVARLELR